MDLSKLIIKCNLEDKDVPVEERKPIKIFISSNGGLLDETMSLVKLIGISKTPVYTIDACYAYSAASLILISGHKRYAMPGTKCLFHSGSGGASGTFEQVQAATEDYKKMVEQMQEYIMSRTNIEKKLFNKKCKIDDKVKGIPNIPNQYLPDYKLVVKHAIVPTSSEIRDNPRARSSKLRVIERIKYTLGEVICFGLPSWHRLEDFFSDLTLRSFPVQKMLFSRYMG